MSKDPLARVPIEQVRIADIEVGVRRRRKPGGLGSLARSIERHGLLHPILLRGTELVFGSRRLEACHSLGWTTIAVRRVDTLTEAEFRQIELDENVERRDLDTYETSKARVAEMEQARAAARAVSRPARAEKRPHRGTGQKPTGRPKKEDSRRAVAEDTGVSRAEQQRVEAHVRLAEAHPFFKRGEWARHEVLKAGEYLAKLPAREHPKLAVILDQPGVPPRTALRILENMAETLTPADRAEIYRDLESSDFHVVDQAMSRAAAVPPNPDPAFMHLAKGRDSLKQAAKVCRVPALVPRIQAATATVVQLLSEL